MFTQNMCHKIAIISKKSPAMNMLKMTYIRRIVDDIFSELLKVYPNSGYFL